MLRLVSSASPAVPTVWDVPEDDPSPPSEDEYLLKLGATLKHVRRKLLKVNQPEVARRVGREKNTISRWENGRTSLSAFNLAQLWTALEIPAEWLLDPTDSVTELDRRIALLRRVASEAAASAAAEPRRRSGGGRAAPRDTR